MTDIDWNALPGRLIVVSGPSGSGKSTILRRALANPNVRAKMSISATSRPPRPGEVPGRDYLFHDRQQFEQARDQGAYLEWAEVHGNLYGTPIEPVVSALKDGDCVLLEIDVQGAKQVGQTVPTAITVFITVPSLDVLEARLRGRGTEDEATVRRRLDNARNELEAIDWYQQTIVNHDLDQAVDDLIGLLVQVGCGGSNDHA